MPGSSPATIFIVDDDPGLLRLVDRALARKGFIIATAASGREAITWLGQNNADLMLLDLKLQDIEGKELLNHLVDAGRPIPFIIVTGQGDERIAVEMMKRGALDYLVKDVQFIELVPTIVSRTLEQLEKDKRLAAAQATLKESQEQVLTISERERARFGAELHDGLGQQLTAIELQCVSMKKLLPADRTDLQKRISGISRHLREAIAQTRALARGLFPVILGTGGLAEALGELAGSMSRDGRLKCTFECSAAAAVDDVVVGQLFRMAQEAVNNAAKHSGATKVALRLSQDAGCLELEISDNGRGFPKTQRLNPGIGLQIMKHRASVIGAELELKSKPGKGVTVTCRLKASQ